MREPPNTTGNLSWAPAKESRNPSLPASIGRRGNSSRMTTTPINQRQRTDTIGEKPDFQFMRHSRHPLVKRRKQRMAIHSTEAHHPEHQ